MKKMLVLLMCVAAVPAMAAGPLGDLKFHQTGVYISPDGHVIKEGYIDTRGWTFSNDPEPKEESSPADYTVISRDGDKVKLWDSRRSRTYDCDKNGCR